MYRILSLFIFSIFSVNCGFITFNKKIEIKTINDLEYIFKYKFSDLNQVTITYNKNSLITKDTLIEGEDQNCFGKSYFFKKELLFTIAQFSNNKDSVSIIEVIHPLLKTSFNISVKSEFTAIKKLIDFETWRSFPDGYIMFKDRKNHKLVYSMDIPDESTLFTEPLSEEKFPDTIKIKSILLYK